MCIQQPLVIEAPGQTAPADHVPEVREAGANFHPCDKPQPVSHGGSCPYSSLACLDPEFNCGGQHFLALELGTGLPGSALGDPIPQLCPQRVETGN